MTFTEFAHKKVLGVPVLYLAGAAVVILAVVAWKMKPSQPSTEDAGDTTGGSEADNAINPSDYSGLASNGTVVVTNPADNPADTEPVIKTNSDWVREGAEWLTAHEGVSGSQAFSALSKYVNGVDRSFQEQEWVDEVIKEKGQPPDDIAEGGSTGPKPAQKQFPSPPGTHTITGNSDNGYPELAQLYYGSANADLQDNIQAANVKLGLHGPWAVGTKVVIPAPRVVRLYTVTDSRGEGKAAIAAKNGLTRSQLEALNNGATNWDKYGGTLPKGYKVRVFA